MVALLAAVERLVGADGGAGQQRFSLLCGMHGLSYAGVPLRAIDPRGATGVLQAEGGAFSATLVASYLRLQRMLYRDSPRIRHWIDDCCTHWGRHLNHAALAHIDPPHLWCRGDEVPLPNGGTIWAEQEVDDGGLGPDSAMEWCFLGSQHLLSAYVRAFESVGWGRDATMLVIVVGASYGAYLPWTRYLAAAAGSLSGRPVRVLSEEEPNFAASLQHAVESGALFHNFFECYRHDRFFRPAWVPLLEAWSRGHARMWPAPAIFYEWKGWPIVFHDPARLEPAVRVSLVSDPHYVEIMRHLPRAWFLGDLGIDAVVGQRARFVVKPAFGGGSYGVRAGAETGAQHFRQHLRRFGSGEHVIVQELAHSRRAGDRFMKVAPHYFFFQSAERVVAHVMTRPSRIVHVQRDSEVSVVVIGEAECAAAD